jgi:hypothetical protein
MKIPPLPFIVTDWSSVALTVHSGETGEAIWRTFTIGDLRVRQVEYTPGYLADHWCDLGHVLYVLEGELDTELRDGRTFKLLTGMSFRSPMTGTRRIGRQPARVQNSSSSINGGHSAARDRRIYRARISTSGVSELLVARVSDSAPTGPGESRISGGRRAKLPGDRPSWQRR